MEIIQVSLQLLLCIILVSTQNAGGDNANNDKIAPKVHQIIQLTIPVEVDNSVVEYNDDTLVLECIASGNPIPTISWSFNGVKFEKGKNPDGTDTSLAIRHTLTSNKLTIKKVKGQKPGEKELYDTGRYRCIATNEIGSVFVEKFISIRVMGRFNVASTENKGATIYKPVIGKDYKIECPGHTMGHGTEYRWGKLKSNSRTPEWWDAGYPNERVFPDYKTGRLWWSVVTQDDIIGSGNIGGVRCILVNHDKYEFSNQQKLQVKSGETDQLAKPIIVVPLLSKMIAPVDTEYSLICGATGNPVPMIEWEYQGVKLKPKVPGKKELNFEFFVLLGLRNQELRIRRITEYSGGSFKCTASNKRGQVLSRGQLSVQFPPKWIKSFPDSMELVFQNKFELVCNATGTPRPKFRWYHSKNGIIGPQMTNDTEGRKTVSGEGSGHNGGVLKIKTIKDEDDGIYICVAENKLNTLTQSVYLKVEQKGPKFDIPLDNPIYLFRSETMKISCNPSGGPIPDKTWLKDGQEIGNDNNRFTSLDNGAFLQITDVNDADAGEYLCRADNTAGESATSSGMAVVLNSTRINRKMEDQRHSVGWGYVVLYCGVEWDQRLDLRVEWYKEGVKMAKFDSHIFLENRATGPPRLLYIKNVTIEDAGNYSCHAYTKVGNVVSEDWSSAILTIKAPPEPPSGVEIESGDCYQEDPKVVLKWNRGEILGAPTRLFYIEFSTNKSSQSDAWFGGKGELYNDAIIAEPGEQVRFTLTKKHLVPGANLIFRLKARSDHMTGRPSRPSRLGTCKTRPAVPKFNPLNVTGYAKAPGKLTVRWRPLTDVYHGGEDFYYEVFYKDESSQSVFVSSQPIRKEPGNDTYPSEFDIQSTGEGVKYEFYVTANNKYGVSKDRAPHVFALTGKQPPKYPPGNVRVTSIDKFSVQLNWDPAENADSYRIRFWNITNAEALRGRNKREVTGNGVVFQYQYSNEQNGGVLVNLTAQVEFLASVASMNSGGISGESALVSFKSQARVPGMPLNVQVVVFGRSAHISWNPPLHPNGYIEQYEISWAISRSDDRSRARAAARTSIKKDRRSREAYMINDFTPFTYYDLRLSARNRVGPGEDYERILFTVGAPDIPGKPGAPLTKPFDDTAINVTFQRPTYGGLPTLFYVYYRPRGNYDEAPKMKKQEFPKRAWILITGLDFLVYDFWTIGINHLGQSETSDLTEQQPIRQLKPQAHASDFEWWRSNWFVAVIMCVLFILITMITVIVLLKDGPKTYKHIHDEKTNGYGGGGYGGDNEMKHMTSKPHAAMGASAMGAGAAYDASAALNDRHDKNFSASEAEDHDPPPPRYSSQSSIEKKELLSDSETGSETGSGSDYSGSETGSGSDYSDEDDGSYYSDEEKKRSDSEEEEDEAEDSTFV